MGLPLVSQHIKLGDTWVMVDTMSLSLLTYFGDL